MLCRSASEALSRDPAGNAKRSQSIAPAELGGLARIWRCGLTRPPNCGRRARAEGCRRTSLRQRTRLRETRSGDCRTRVSGAEGEVLSASVVYGQRDPACHAHGARTALGPLHSPRRSRTAGCVPSGDARRRERISAISHSAEGRVRLLGFAGRARSPCNHGDRRVTDLSGRARSA